eukprot:TRINITY_DN3202_c0_g1_i2.p1 TRINITY_DN3202_c0_g1~~TRINITY_DN3202_c0_g1_i2.p1  ORF type:complete len:112 (+),score=45.64 TRINITY_DN3202_c0_g1_i2:136-471(+)
MEDEAVKVAGHYNARPNMDYNARRESRIVNLKNFNNWVKFVLVRKYWPQQQQQQQQAQSASVLDLCAGKGGDLHKWCARARSAEPTLCEPRAAALHQQEPVSRHFHLRQLL